MVGAGEVESHNPGCGGGPRGIILATSAAQPFPSPQHSWCNSKNCVPARRMGAEWGVPVDGHGGVVSKHHMRTHEATKHGTGKWLRPGSRTPRHASPPARQPAIPPHANRAPLSQARQ